MRLRPIPYLVECMWESAVSILEFVSLAYDTMPLECFTPFTNGGFCPTLDAFHGIHVCILFMVVCISSCSLSISMVLYILFLPYLDSSFNNRFVVLGSFHTSQYLSLVLECVTSLFRNCISVGVSALLI